MATPQTALRNLSQVRSELHSHFSAMNTETDLAPIDGPLVPGFHVISKSNWSVIPSK